MPVPSLPVTTLIQNVVIVVGVGCLIVATLVAGVIRYASNDITPLTTNVYCAEACK